MRAKSTAASEIDWRSVNGYVIAALGATVAASSHWWLAPLTGGTPPMRLILVVVVLAAAWLGGFGPGLFATVLGLIAIVAANDAPGDYYGLSMRLLRFGSLALLLSFLFRALHASQRLARAREQDHRDRYRQLVETTAQGIWVLDRDDRTTHANPRLGEILDIPPQTMIGRSLQEFLVDASEAPRNWSERFGRSQASHEVRLRASDGSIRNTIMSAWPIGPDEIPGDGEQSPAGPAGGLLLKVTDLTRMKQAEDALRDKESVLRCFYESSPRAMGVIHLTEDDGRFVSANTILSHLLGYPSGKVEGLAASELGAAAEVRSLWIERFRECRATGRPIRFEYYSDWPKASTWVAATIDAMVTPGSDRVLCSFILEDITKHKAAENELREAKEVAEAASRAKDRFLAVLSHELRTPLTPVLIAVSSLLESNPDPRSCRCWR